MAAETAGIWNKKYGADEYVSCFCIHHRSFTEHDFEHRFMGLHQTTFWRLLLQAGMLARLSPQVKARAETHAFWQVYPGPKVIHRAVVFFLRVVTCARSSQY